MKRRILNITFWITGLLTVVVLLSFVENQRAEAVCTGLEINVAGEEETPFLTQADVAWAVGKLYPQVLQTPMSEINIQLLEDHLKKLDAVANAEVFSKLDGRLWVRIKQRKPLARILLPNKNYYLDTAGKPMALSPHYTANVVLVTGEGLASHHSEITQLVKLIQQEEQLAEVISGIERVGNGKYILYPAIGHHKVLLGGLDGAAKRLKKLAVFYAKGMEAASSEEVTWINLQYKDQVIIKKRGYGN